MVKNSITIGNKVDVARLQKLKNGDDFPILSSKVVDIIDDTTLVISMPMDKTVTIPLSSNEKVELFFYAQNSILSASAVAMERYYEGTIPVVKLKFVSPLEKFQRRQFYRIECYIPFSYHTMTEEEMKTMLEFRGSDRSSNQKFYEHLQNAVDETTEWKDGVILDLSGGGMRFVTDVEPQKSLPLLLTFDITVGQEKMTLNLILIIISVEEKREIRGKFEVRAKFYRIKDTFRDTIVKFVFDEERRIRSKSSDME